MTLKFTTPSTIVSPGSIYVTVPANVFSGNASIVIRTSFPTDTLPTLTSDTFASISRLLPEITETTGVPTETISPRFASCLVTIPVNGDRIVIFES